MGLVCNKDRCLLLYHLRLTLDLYVVAINDKPCTRAKEVCRALKYNKKTADLIKDFFDRENYAQKYQLIKFPAAGSFVNWLKDSKKDDYYIIEEGRYKLIFASQQPKAKYFRKHYCNVMFPRI